MARLRILQRPSCCDPAKARFDIQEKVLWWWELVNFAWTIEEAIEEAEQFLLDIRAEKGILIETKVIKEYN
jgi:hypothetical protein